MKKDIKFNPETDEVFEEAFEVEEESPKEDFFPEKVSKKKKFKVKCVVVNAWIFQGPTFVSRGLVRTKRGNLMTVLGEEDDWYEVELPRRDSNVVGFIQKDKVVKV